MATFLNDLRLTELATGEGSGSWGTTTNVSLELIGEALGYATQQVFSSDANATTTVADGSSDPARAMYFKITSAGNLTATRTCTIAPNTVSRVMFIENATSGSQSIAISQGSGANVTILTGKTAVVYLDGAGSGAAVVDAMAGVDPGVTDTLTEVLVAGNASGGTNIELSTTDKVQFRDAAIYINSSVDGQLDIVADTEIQIAATTIDINGAINASGDIIAVSLDISGNIDVDGTANLDILDVDGASNFAADVTFATSIDVDGTANLDVVDIDGAVNMATTALVTGVLTTTAATVFNGGFASNADSTLGTDKKVQFRDAAIYINSSADGQLDIVADTEIQIAATTIDINGAIVASGEISAASLDISGDIDVDGTSNLDIVDIDGAVNMATTALVTGVLTTTAATVFNGGFASNADSTLGTDKKVQFRDSAIYINSSTDGQLDIVADTEIQIAATTIDINGAINASGEIIAASLDISGNVDIDGTTNLDIVDVDGAVNFAADVTFANGADIITASAGTSNFRAGVDAGNSIQDGGNFNTVVGDQAGTAITTGDSNVIVGMVAGDALTEASDNVAIGQGALTDDTKGSKSVAIGRQALTAQNFTSATATHNTAVGHNAGVAVTTGVSNTLIAALAGNALTSGSNNMFLGKDSGRSGSPGGNITTGSNEIVLGDENISAANIQVDWTVASDARDKTDFTALDLGLDFVKALAPVTYKWDKRSKYGDKTADDYDLNAQTPDGTHKEDWLDIGFKAQEVEALEIAAGYNKSNKTNLVSSHTGDGKQMGLQYSKFVPILVKAMQEQNALIESLTARITTLEG